MIQKNQKEQTEKTIAAVIVFLIVAITLVILTVDFILPGHAMRLYIDLAKMICFTIFNLNIYLTAGLVISRITLKPRFLSLRPL